MTLRMSVGDAVHVEEGVARGTRVRAGSRGGGPARVFRRQRLRRVRLRGGMLNGGEVGGAL